MNPQRDFLEAIKVGTRLAPAPPIMMCSFCREWVALEYLVDVNRFLYRHRVMQDFQLTWERLTPENFCPNNAKIWILEPDMVTLREI